MTPPRHDPKPLDIALHWLIAVGIVGMIGFGFVIGAMERGPDKTALVNVHKSFGILIGAFALWRLVRRVREGFFDPAGARMPWEIKLAQTSHIALLALTVLMPLTGILKSVTYARPVEFFGLPLLPPLLAEKNPFLNDLASVAHEGFAWALVALILVHVAAALKHQLVDRDGTLARMLPGGSRTKTA